jgi:hypothetical protein
MYDNISVLLSLVVVSIDCFHLGSVDDFSADQLKCVIDVTSSLHLVEEDTVVKFICTFVYFGSSQPPVLQCASPASQMQQTTTGDVRYSVTSSYSVLISRSLHNSSLTCQLNFRQPPVDLPVHSYTWKSDTIFVACKSVDFCYN